MPPTWTGWNNSVLFACSCVPFCQGHEGKYNGMFITLRVVGHLDGSPMRVDINTWALSFTYSLNPEQWQAIGNNQSIFVKHAMHVDPEGLSRSWDSKLLLHDKPIPNLSDVEEPDWPGSSSGSGSARLLGLGRMSAMSGSLDMGDTQVKKTGFGVALHPAGFCLYWVLLHWLRLQENSPGFSGGALSPTPWWMELPRHLDPKNMVMGRGRFVVIFALYPSSLFFFG